MKIIIAGSRSVTSYDDVAMAISESKYPITEVVSGAARGVDRLGEQFAKKNKLHLKQFHPDWNLFGKLAGFLRNSEMALYADGLIAVWDGESKGTAHMIKEMQRIGKPVYIKKV